MKALSKRNLTHGNCKLIILDGTSIFFQTIMEIQKAYLIFCFYHV